MGVHFFEPNSYKDLKLFNSAKLVRTESSPYPKDTLSYFTCEYEWYLKPGLKMVGIDENQLIPWDYHQDEDPCGSLNTVQMKYTITLFLTKISEYFKITHPGPREKLSEVILLCAGNILATRNWFIQNDYDIPESYEQVAHYFKNVNDPPTDMNFLENSDVIPEHVVYSHEIKITERIAILIEMAMKSGVEEAWRYKHCFKAVSPANFNTFIKKYLHKKSLVAKDIQIGAMSFYNNTDFDERTKKVKD